LPETFLAQFRRHVAASPHQTALVFLDERGVPTASLTYGELDRRARSIASFLEGRTEPGDRVVLAFTAPLEFAAALIACAYARTVGVPVSMPSSGKNDKGRFARIAAIAADCSPSVALSSRALIADVWPYAAAHGIVLECHATDDISTALPHGYGEGADPGDLFFLQYTSGSTGTPRGVRVSHASVAANLLEMFDVIGYDTSRPFVSWLPHFHDMGLLTGLLFPLHFGSESYLMAPAAFLKRPVRWLEAITTYRAASTVAPNFALDLCARRIPPAARMPLDLTCLTTLSVGAEPISEATLRRFTEEFAPHGFARSAWAPGYGLAESTVFATTHRSEGGYQVLTVAGGATAVSCGRTASGASLRIVGFDDRRVLPDGETGEVVLAGPSVTDGYWSSPADRVTLSDPCGGSMSYVATGDVGAVIDGELAVVGRIKDVIIMNGANHHAADIEATVLGATEGFMPGGCAAFGAHINGQERLVVAIEVDRTAVASPSDLLGDVRVAVAAQHDVIVHDLVLLRRGHLPRTSSGKVKRYACRESFCCGKLR
jgi:acyl-CoA synthetase (AMP-forming)/AMP-acid ligase II